MALSLGVLMLVLVPCTLGFDASKVLERMKPKAKPCDDFYEYACGNYPKVVGAIPDGVDQIDFYYELEENLKKQLKTMLDTGCYVKNNPAYYLVRQLYRGCRNITAIEKRGLDPLKETLEDLGGWPTVVGESWDEGKFDWLQLAAKIDQEQYRSTVIGLYVIWDEANANKRVLQIHSPSFIFPDLTQYWDPEYKEQVEAYKRLLVNTAMQFGAPSKSEAEKDANEMFKLEAELALNANKSMTKEGIQKLLTFEELFKIPGINFKSIFEQIQKDNNFTLPNSEKLINISAGYYIEKLPGVLKKYDARTIANFIVSRVALGNLKYVAPRLRAEYYEFLEKLGHEPQQRWEECLEVVKQTMQWPLSYMYVNEYFKSDTIKNQAKQLADQLKQTMVERLEDLDWMDQSTKAIAKSKVEKIRNLFGYPENILDLSFVMRDYEGVSTNEQQYYESVVSSWKSYLHRDLRKLLTPVTNDSWEYEPAYLSYFYYKNNMNLYTISALQDPLYFSDAPDPVNYGRLGVDIATSVIAALDEYGRYYDENGMKDDWFSSKSAKGFEWRMKCLRDQYAKIKDKETGQYLGYGGDFPWWNAYLSEDNGGVILAYKAMHEQKDRRRKRSPQVDEGLTKFSDDELFFISYAQKLCGVYAEGARNETIQAGEVPPFDHRVNVPLQNFEQFADTFKCKSGDAMNPKKRCTLF